MAFEGGRDLTVRRQTTTLKTLLQAYANGDDMMERKGPADDVQYQQGQVVSKNFPVSSRKALAGSMARRG